MVVKLECEVVGVELMERKDFVVSVSICFIGLIDTRCVIVRRNLEIVINV